MSERDDGGAAFPRPDWNGSWVGPNSYRGMSLRDWFAGQALVHLGEENWSAQEAAEQAYRIADAMLKARG